MANNKRALITGITGQDGSYLADHLLDLGYEVFGMERRSSHKNHTNVTHIENQINWLAGDLTDQNSLARCISSSKPHEVYNLAAQSFVKESWNSPEYTGDVTGLGTLRMLEAIRESEWHNSDDCPGGIRFYQASSSEMFGRQTVPAANEETLFYPRSPYGVAKLYAHWITRNYRESYGIFATSGILFNHECVTASTPIIIRDKNGFIDCVPIAEVLPDPYHTPQRELNIEVWDKDGWVRAKFGTATWNEGGRKGDKRVHRTLARSGEVRTTADHQLILEDSTEISTEDVSTGQRLLTTGFPNPSHTTEVTPDRARLLGLMAADGYVGYRSGRYRASFRNNNPDLLDEVAKLWKQCGGTASPHPGRSGFTDSKPTNGIHLTNSQGNLHILYDSLYTKDGSKRVPQIVLNADESAWRAFLEGYNLGDGLKGGSGTHEFKNFKTSSPVLAAGLWWLASQVLDQKLTLNVDMVERKGVQYHYYSINLGVPGGSSKGTHLIKPGNEVKRIREEQYTGWLYDIETESGTFHAGVGNLVIHNSPRRGLEFVTRKITDGVAKIFLGYEDYITLGNLDAKRDWGHAGDYVKAMHLMLQHDIPDDFVIATGQSHSIRDFLDAAFKHVHIPDWSKYIKQDARFMRPAEVDYLRGDSTKAREILGWECKKSFNQLVAEMVTADVERLTK